MISLMKLAKGNLEFHFRGKEQSHDFFTCIFSLRKIMKMQYDVVPSIEYFRVRQLMENNVSIDGISVHYEQDIAVEGGECCRYRLMNSLYPLTAIAENDSINMVNIR
jgi:hypothetical protein